MSEGAMVPGEAIERFVKAALAEDVGRGDRTTAATVDPEVAGEALLVFRQPGVVCGLPVAAAVFRALDAAAHLEMLVAEGTALAAPGEVARIRGRARALLSGERLALNVVARLSATATLTRRYVDAVAGTRAQILDTRKTTPLLRELERYAVRVGGGHNHRFNLEDGVLIKDNHLRLAGGITAAVRAAKAAVPAGMPVEVEVETLEGLREALAAGAEMVLLDNMRPALLREAVAIAGGRAVLEASGGITLENVRAVAETGVDRISVGALTHSAGSLDVALEVP